MSSKDKLWNNIFIFVYTKCKEKNQKEKYDSINDRLWQNYSRNRK